MFDPNPTSTVLTIDDLQRKKTLAHYQKLVRESDRMEALNTLAHYAAMVCQAQEY